MLKRTIYFGNAAYLNLNNGQLVVRLSEKGTDVDLPEIIKLQARATIPIEDIGVVVIDHQQVTITQGLLSALVDNNAAVIVCDSTHMPTGLLLPLDKHNIQHERFKTQTEATVPLKKQLWQQTVEAKIANQAALLEKTGHDAGRLRMMKGKVKSGDPENREGAAAHYYWGELFRERSGFARDRYGLPPNNLLNYGYAILRAITSRSLVGSGLLPTLGIHHSNRYNAYCLADDIMEPYRPYVDELVYHIAGRNEDFSELTTGLKKELLQICTTDVRFGDERSPLMVGMQRTSSSLAQCFAGDKRKIAYPEFQ